MNRFLPCARARWGRGLLGFLAVWLLASGLGHAQTLNWQTAVAAAGNVQVQASTPDGTGNVYLAGGFTGTATFGGTTLSTANGQELFVAKWNATNGFVWAVKGTGSSTTGRNLATAVTVSNTAVFVAGNFVSGTLALGSTTLTNAQAGTSDLFVVRLNTVSGGMSLARRAGGLANDYATSISAFTTTYVYVGGSSGGNATFDNYTLASAGGFIARYSGNSTSAQPASPAPVVRAGDAVTALSYANGFLYAAGTASGAAAAVPGGTLPNAGGEDLFVLKLNYIDQNLPLWALQAGGSGDDYARCLLVSGSSVYIGGSYQSATLALGSTTLANSGVAKLFVSKLADAGTAASFTWAAQNGGTSTDPSNTANALGLYGNSLYVAGAFSGTATFGSRTLTSAGGSDVLIAKLADAGSSASFVAAEQAGGPGADYATGLGRLDPRTGYATGQVATPASFGAISLGSGSGVAPGFVATFSDPAPLLTLVAPNAGPVGTAVTLYGQGLAGTTAIAFAGTSNNVVTSGFTVNAAGTQISGVVVPAGAQSGPVNATTAQGTSNSLVGYTVLTAPNPAPAWQSATVANNTSLVRWATPAAGGMVVVAGEFSGSIALGGTTLISAGGTDVFVAKFNPATGSYLWAVRGGSSSDEDAFANVVVNGNNIYLAGQFFGTSITLGGTTLTAAVPGLSGYVAKLTDAGSSASFTWAQLLDDGSGVFVEALAVSGTNVYVGGDFTGPTLTIGNGSIGSNASGDDGYVAKLVDNGSTASFVWAKSMGSTSGATVNVYGLNAKGSSVYLSGTLYGTVSFDNITLTSVSTSDMVVARLLDNGSAGSFTAAVQSSSAGNESVYSMSQQGNALYVSGVTSSGAWPGTSVSGSGIGFVAKVTDTGTGLSVNWVQLLQGIGFQTAANGTGVYVATSLGGASTFGGTPIQSAGSSDGLVLRLVDGGNSVSIAWAQAAGGLGVDYFRALALVAGRVVVGGSVTPLAAFGSTVITAPEGVAVAALGVLADPAVLATGAAHLRAPLALYPNPAHGQVIAGPLAGGETVRLFDPLGREVRQYAVPAGAAEALLDLRGLPGGLYVLRTKAGSRQLVVEQ